MLIFLSIFLALHTTSEQADQCLSLLLYSKIEKKLCDVGISKFKLLNKILKEKFCSCHNFETKNNSVLNAFFCLHANFILILLPPCL